MGSALFERIAARIRARGPVTFAEFMTMALYDPEEGFFTRAPVGREFVTAAHVSPMFGALMAVQLLDAWEKLRRPEPFTVVDVGAGDGMLARQILAADLPMKLDYVAVEWSLAARAGLEALGIQARATLAGPFTGCVIANELFDNIPFHRLRGVDGRTVEVCIGLDGERFVEIETEPTIAHETVPDGEECPVAPGARTTIDTIARALTAGYTFIIDYGFVAGETPEPIRSYKGHRLEHDVLADPGDQDITGPVDFAALIREARANGLTTWGPVTQREALLALGYHDLRDGMRAQQAEAEAAGEHRRAIELFGARNDAAMLIDPDGLGALRFLALGTANLPAPRALVSTPSLA